MKLPPLVARVRIRTARRSFALWVPLFLLWALLLVLLAPVLLLALVVMLLLPPRWRVRALAGGVYTALCETRGTHVDLERPRTRVSVALR